jgi:hypothetical protein
MLVVSADAKAVLAGQSRDDAIGLATDRDRDDRLSVLLLARRGHGAWRSLVTGPARGSLGLRPKTLGGRGSLTLRLEISDGFNTALAGSRPIAVR